MVFCDNHVEFAKSRAVKETWIAESVTANDPEVLKIMEEQVHSGNGRCCQVDLLSVKAERAAVATGFTNLVDGFNEHSTRAAGWVVDGLSGLGIEDAHEKTDHGPGSEELASLLPDSSANWRSRYS